MFRTGEDKKEINEHKRTSFQTFLQNMGYLLKGKTIHNFIKKMSDDKNEKNKYQININNQQQANSKNTTFPLCQRTHSKLLAKNTHETLKKHIHKTKVNAKN